MSPRPIGTEIEIYYPPSPYTTRPCFTIWKYRIAGHLDTTNGPGETLDPVSKREFPITTMMFWMGKMMPVPPAECLPFLDAGWKALYEHATQRS